MYSGKIAVPPGGGGKVKKLLAIRASKEDLSVAPFFENYRSTLHFNISDRFHRLSSNNFISSLRIYAYV
jgi:hypothetical protein